MQGMHPVARIVTAAVLGLLFGLGLSLSEMVNPVRVIGFLRVTDAWDPTLVFVMGGALLISFPSFYLMKRLSHPVLEQKFFMPSATKIDARLVSGALLFGIGWGLAGLCPGPAITGLATLQVDVLLFFGAMVAGMLLHQFTLEK